MILLAGRSLVEIDLFGSRHVVNGWGKDGNLRSAANAVRFFRIREIVPSGEDCGRNFVGFEICRSDLVI